MSTQTDTLPRDPAGAEVAIVGAGPTGLLLARELAATGVRTVVLERAAEPDETPKGNGVIGRSVVELKRRHLLRGTGLRVRRPPRFRFGPFTLSLGRLRGPLHILPVPQRQLERLLAEQAVRLGATIRRGHDVTGFDQDGDGVTIRAVAQSSDVELRVSYLVGCDGARSFVRHHLGIEFPGITSGTISRIARITIPAAAITRRGDEVDVRGVGRLATFRPQRTEHGSVTLAPADVLDPSAPADLYIVSTHEPRGASEPTDALSEAELRASLRRVLGSDVPFTTAYAARSVVANSRQAQRYRDDRVFLAGDAAHIFSAGGSAINAGLLDAIALGQRLVAVLRQGAPVDVLDDYQAQRHPAAERTLALTRVQVGLEAGDETGDALRAVLGELVKDRGTARRIAALMEG